MKVEVFVSYVSDDHNLASQLADYLKDWGLNVWWDNYVPSRSTNFREEVFRALDISQSTVLIWTSNARIKKSSWVEKEAEIARDQGKLILVCINGEEPGVWPLEYCQCKKIALHDRKFREVDLDSIRQSVQDVIGIHGAKEHVVQPRKYGESWQANDLALEGPVPGTDIFVSFRPCGESGLFLLIRNSSSSGWVSEKISGANALHAAWKRKREWEKEPRQNENGHLDKDRKRELAIFCDNQGVFSYNKMIEDVQEEPIKHLRVDNEILFIRDPVRPFGIQIGELRSLRPSNKPGEIVAELSEAKIHFLATEHAWLATVLADTLTDPNSLQALYNYIKKQQSWDQRKINHILEIISRNPNAPKKLQTEWCDFCQDSFIAARRLTEESEEEKYGAYLFANDFPFGSFFHYIVAVRTKDRDDPVHSWERMSCSHFIGMNLLIHDYLKHKAPIKNIAGVQVGFNSTVRHIVLGERTHSSAGASIPHIHKQVWALSPKTSNLAEHLIQVCEGYENLGIDYLGCYQRALTQAGYVVWQDEYVLLYIPYGQSSLHELQAMIKRPTDNFSVLTREEVISLSVAEYFTKVLYEGFGLINSFNHVMLSKLYRDNRAQNFRVIETFVTREVDLAVSELSMLYVVDQHPSDSAEKIKNIWRKVKACEKEKLNNYLSDTGHAFFPSESDFTEYRNQLLESLSGPDL